MQLASKLADTPDTAPLREAAVAYARLGWRVVPVEPQSKKPADGNGWQEASFRRTPELLERHWRRPFNVGVLLGPESGELVDVDLDVPEARALADEYLPPGAFIFGRPGSPRSHRLYRSPGALLLQLHDLPDAERKRATLVELRAKPATATGAQTVLPPSVHTSGERIEWDADAADALELPAEVEAGTLSTAVRRLAVAAFLARHLGGVDAARRYLAAPAAGSLKPEVAAHARELLGLPPVAVPQPPRPAPRPRQQGDKAGLPEGWQERWNAAGIAHAAGVLGLAWDDTRRALRVCPFCDADTRSSSDKRAAAGVVKARTTGVELWRHGKCNGTGDAVSLASCAVLGMKYPTTREQWRELEEELRAKGWQ